MYASCSCCWWWSCWANLTSLTSDSPRRTGSPAKAYLRHAGNCAKTGLYWDIMISNHISLIMWSCDLHPWKSWWLPRKSWMSMAINQWYHCRQAKSPQAPKKKRRNIREMVFRKRSKHLGDARFSSFWDDFELKYLGNCVKSRESCTESGIMTS